MSRLSPSLRETAIFAAIALLGVAISASLSPAAARSAKCPVWTSAIIDSFAADGGLFQGNTDGPVPPEVDEPPLDDPTIPKMFCSLIVPGASAYFDLNLGQVRRPVRNLNEVFLEAGDPVVGTNVLYQTLPEGDVGAAHACRAEVLQSFVWNQFCAPELP